MDQSIPRARYEAILRRVGDLPSLPDIVNRTVEILGQSNTPAAQVAKLISYDPGLTSKVLRMVNSAAYGFQRQISSVQHAIMILGFGTVRGVVLSASIFKMFESKQQQVGLDPNEFWRHSIATAIGSRILASQWKIRYSEDAFSAGMLHDIGKMILNYYFAADYIKVVHESKRMKIFPHGPHFVELEHKMLGTNHAELGYYLAQRWKLPATFAEVIRYHHQPALATDAPDLVYVVALANAFSHLLHQNYGVFNIEFIPEEVLTYFYEGDKNEAAFERLFKQVLEEMEGIEDLLSTMKI